jgi:hypothetical protein
LIAGEAKGKPHVISECMVTQKATRWMISIRTQRDKWILNRLGRTGEYFDLSADPQERASQSNLPSPLRETYTTMIETWLADFSPEGQVGFVPTDFSPEMIRILKDIGYLN